MRSRSTSSRRSFGWFSTVSASRSDTHLDARPSWRQDLGMARWLGTALVVLVLASASGCGLTLDYAPPDPQRRDGGDGTFDAGLQGHDAGGQDDDAASDDAGSDAVVVGDAWSPSCATASDCGTGQICVSLCNGTGHCIPMGQPCAFVPTCGCDGVIYDSLCSAHGAGVESADDPSLCFGCGAGGVPCPIVGQVCLGCPDAPPTCVSRPFPGPPCTDLPVCGCDGQTYASDCDAEASGVLRFTSGVCAGTCVSSLDCAVTEYCERASCGDVVGRCRLLPSGTATGVCGCSGRRYRSQREALLREGLTAACDRCTAHASGCCIDAADCATGETCIGASHDCTASGVCEPLTTLRDGTCWSDEDCGPRGVCIGQQVCPCAATCFVADMPGTCAP
jgi:hypothetical protein